MHEVAYLSRAACSSPPVRPAEDKMHSQRWGRTVNFRSFESRKTYLTDPNPDSKLVPAVKLSPDVLVMVRQLVACLV
jgi:hypothetical protein